MTARKPQFTPSPRILNVQQAAKRLGMSPATFKKRRDDLEAQSFPRRDELLNGYDAKAIEAWLDRRAGLDVQSPSDDEAMRRMQADG